MINLLSKRIKDFKIIRLIGQGQSGAVFEALDDQKNQLVAIKVMYLRKFKMLNKLKQQVQTQINVLKTCNNPNVISYIDSFEYNEFLFIVTEFCNGGSVDQYLLMNQLTEDQAVIFLKQILNGFKGLHQVAAMHRDFKAANVLLHNGICKIADLGSSKQMIDSSIAKSRLGTPLNNAPEILQGNSYTFNADIWSIGILFYQMIYGKYPYIAKNQVELLEEIKSKRPDYEGVNISDQARDFIQQCLTVDPQERINWVQIYQHPLIVGHSLSKLDKSFLDNRISINQNLKFYSETNLEQEYQKLQTSKTVQNLGSQNHSAVLGSDDLQTLISISELLEMADQIKKKQEIKERFDNLYIGRRNDLMFFYEFIQPYIERVQYLRVNHAVAGFILGKKSYLEMVKFYDNLVNEKLIFYGQSGFEQYIKHDNYSKLINQLKKDIQIMQKICLGYKSQIKISSLQIMKELDLYTIKNTSYDSLANQILADYSKLLKENLGQIKKQDKKLLIKLIYALEYCRNNAKPYSNQFSRMISGIDFQKAQRKIKSMVIL